jgi:hypothetical protein
MSAQSNPARSKIETLRKQTRSVCVAISGSFHRHFSAIADARTRFEGLGVTVLSPTGRKVLNPTAEFPLLAGDDSGDPEILERRHLDAIVAATALYVVNPNSYLGNSVAFEIGWAAALGKPIFTQVRLRELGLRFVVTALASPEETVGLLL